MSIYHPVSAYRLQLHRDFNLKELEKILEYLHKLGIRTIYASPVFRAVEGSTHGYDITDPLSLNPEIGTERAFGKLTGKIHRMGMGWLQDIVPNHMAFSMENPWIRDVLVHGKQSGYYTVFDIIGDHPDRELREKLMLPFFGKSLDGLIGDGELKLQFGERGFALVYYESEFPVSAGAYPFILESGRMPGKLREWISAESMAAAWKTRTRKLFALCSSDPEVAGHVDRCLERINREPERMRSLADRLCYLPVHWKETEKRINYRRFFTINGLICVNVHLEEVFEKTHGLIRTWVKEGMVDGLRIDHIDGLYDPSDYLERLRQVCGSRTYLVAEKIL